MTDDPKYYKRVNIADVVGNVPNKDKPHQAEMTEGEAHMRSFAHSVNTGSDPKPETMRFFANAFSEILRGVDPKDALCLRTGSGYRESPHVKANTLTKEMRIAVMVEEYRMQGYSEDKARDKAAGFMYEHDMKGNDIKTVVRHHRKHKKVAINLIKSFKSLDSDPKELAITFIGSPKPLDAKE